MSILIWFKYIDFFAGLWGIKIGGQKWIPLAISFYLFHIISYAIDLFKRKIYITSAVDYIIYLSFFPHLLAGPIVRGPQLIPQITEPLKSNRFDWSGGVYQFALGFLLKNSADRIADVIDPYWTTASPPLSSADHWLVAILYSAQIFSDFAGYSFLAMGMAKLLGYELPENFNAPYLARSFREFWYRWHITLSAFLRDYLYVFALGGNRKGTLRSTINLGVTLLLGGLWHGAALHFVCWGAIHGAALMVERGLGIAKPHGATRPILAALWFVIVQLAVILAWVVFRSPDIPFAIGFLKAMFTNYSGVLSSKLIDALVFMIPAVLHHLSRALPPAATTFWKTTGVGAGAMLFAGLMTWDIGHGFIYFKF